MLWAVLGPVDPPLVLHETRAIPARVRAGDKIIVTTKTDFRQPVVMSVTPRIEGSPVVVFLPTTTQSWPAGERVVSRLIEIPPLDPGRYVYQPLFEVRVNPLRTITIEGLRAEFEVVP